MNTVHPQFIDVSEWLLAPDYDGIYPKGAREKSLYISPLSIQPPFKPGWLYLFKKSSDRYPWQFLVEYLCYEIGSLCSIPVPFTALAKDRDGNYGALVEWFYNKFDPNHKLYLDGGEILSHCDTDYDRTKGTRHNLEGLLQICMWLEIKYRTSHNLTLSLLKMLLFDTLIGNTDRHHDNWGIIFRKDKHKKYCLQLSPCFDNGTSFGHEILDSNITKKYATKDSRVRYVNKGHHHIKYKLGGDHMRHIDTSRYIYNNFPSHLNFIKNFLYFDENIAFQYIANLGKIECPIVFSPERIDFMTEIFQLRLQSIREGLQ